MLKNPKSRLYQRVFLGGLRFFRVDIFPPEIEREIKKEIEKEIKIE